MEKGLIKTAPVLRRAFTHFTKTALVAEKDPDKGTNQYKRVVRKIGIDPHHSYANMLCDVAMARVFGNALMLWFDNSQDAGDADGVSPLPEPFVQLINETKEKRQGCGTCNAYARGEDDQPLTPSGHCQRRNFTTEADYPTCEMFEPAE